MSPTRLARETLIAPSLDIGSHGGSATNYGVFNSTGSYTQISVGGVAQTTGEWHRCFRSPLLVKPGRAPAY